MAGLGSMLQLQIVQRRRTKVSDCLEGEQSGPPRALARVLGFMGIFSNAWKIPIDLQILGLPTKTRAGARDGPGLSCMPSAPSQLMPTRVRLLRFQLPNFRTCGSVRLAF